MPEGMSELQRNIQTFETLLEDLREEKREIHGLLKDVREERRIIEKMMHDDVKKRVMSEVDKVVRVELEKINPEIRKQTNRIYDKMTEQINKLVDLSLGKEFSTKRGRSDLRPVLAAKLREWILEVIETEQAVVDAQLKESSG